MLMIIGVTGTRSSGKGYIGEFLKSKGFVYLSTSEEVRNEARRRGLEITRSSLQVLARDMRKEFGGTIFARKCIEKMQEGNNYFVDGIRNPTEIEELRKLKDFSLIAVDAPTKLRYERAKERGEIDSLSWEHFLELDEIDNANKDPEGQQNFLCMKMADFSIYNDCDESTFVNKIKEILEEIRS